MHNRKSSIFEFNKALIAYKFVTFDLSAFLNLYIFNVLSCYFIYTQAHSHDKISCGTVKVDFHHRA